MNNFHFCVFCLIINSIAVISVVLENDYSLKSLNVIFRHGDRTPLGKEFGGNEKYPNDPYLNETFEPIGLGALTNEGKLREYQLGKSLRRQYGDFLGEIYKPTKVVARSTDYPRTKMSTQLVLAGLYPPEGQQIWNDDLKWQPIPIFYAPNLFDPALHPSSCPVYIEELAHIRNSSQYKNDRSLFNQQMKELTVITGKKIEDTHHIYQLYHLLVAEKAANLELPLWTKHYFPYGPMRDATLFHYKTMSYNELMKKIRAGFMIRKILKNMKKVIKSENINKPKIFLYGVHETNIAGILIGLNLWQRQIPEYSSAIVLELHQKSSDYFVKLQYYKGIPAVFEKLILPNCTEFCPIEKFIELTKKIVPENVMETCYGPAMNSKLVPPNENAMKWMYEKFVTIFDI